jgi:hypothetical protein
METLTSIKIKTKNYKHNLKFLLKKNNLMVDPSSSLPNLHKTSGTEVPNWQATTKIEQWRKELSKNSKGIT